MPNHSDNQFIQDLVSALESVIARPEYASDPDKVAFVQADIVLLKGYIGVPAPGGPGL